MPYYLNILFKLGIISLFIFSNAFFVASEFALVSVRKTRIQQLVKEGSETAILVFREFEEIEKFIAAVQLGVTISSLGLGWVGQATLSEIFYPFFTFIFGFWKFIAVHTFSAITAFVIITTFHVVLGELVPKSIALQYSERVSLHIARPMFIISKLFYPVIVFLNKLGSLILKPLNISPAKGLHLVHSVEELDMIISDSYQEGILNATEHEMLHNVFKFSDLIARQIMIPRPDMICIQNDITLDKLIEFVEEHQFTRYPVYENDLDHIPGIVHIKDVFLCLEGNGQVDISNIIRKVMLIPETLTIDKLLLEFKKHRSQMAIVVDEFGGTSGLVTLEDVLEEIFGDVQDEFDIEEADIKILSENEYIVNAMLRIDEINEYFNLDISVEEIETIGGLIVKELGRIANVGDEVAIDNYTFRVESIDGARITKLRIKRV